MALTPLDGVEIEAGLEFLDEAALAGSRITDDGKDRPLALFKVLTASWSWAISTFRPINSALNPVNLWVFVGSSLAEMTL